MADGFTRAGNHVFFASNSGEIGSELWALPADVLPSICLECPTPTTAGLATPTPTYAGPSQAAGRDSGCRVSESAVIPWPLGLAPCLPLLRCLRRFARLRRSAKP
jgi:hypothetical protein